MSFPVDLKFHSVEEVRAFEQNLLACHLRLSQAPAFEWATLEDAWLVFKQDEGGGRPFALFLDIRLAVLALQQELMELVRGANAEALRERESAPPDLETRVKLFRANSAYILRTRSIIDKVMGFVVITSHPEEYDAFRRSKSRRKAFGRLAARSSRGIGPLASYIGQFAELFDRRYRTAEAHDSGSVRTWVFGNLAAENSRQADMFASWNSLHPILTALGTVVRNARGKVA